MIKLPDPSMQVYADADYAGGYDDGKSTIGIITFFGCAPISWQSTKQKLVS